MELFEIAYVFAKDITSFQGEVHVVSKIFETKTHDKTENGVNVIMSKNLPKYSRDVLGLFIDHEIDIPSILILELVAPVWCFLEPDPKVIKEINSKRNSMLALDFYYNTKAFSNTFWLLPKNSFPFQSYLIDIFLKTKICISVRMFDLFQHGRVTSPRPSPTTRTTL
jgi:hypothetical protein